MQVTTEEIQVIGRLVKDLCGLVLDQTKGYLIESRLTSVAKEVNCQTFSELYYKARYESNKDLQDKIINAITTQETLFFRDNTPFEALQYKVIPEVIDARAKTPFPRRLRIWSAACSTGQEPYSLSIILHELLPDIHNWDVQILATDISDSALKKASLGRYCEMEISRGMKPGLLAKYFIKDGPNYRVKDELRGIIAFKRLNLHDPFVGLGTFDIILCRNVAIYFDADARRSLFQRFTQVLAPDGYQFVGATESLIDLGPQYMPQNHCRAVFYRPNLRR